MHDQTFDQLANGQKYNQLRLYFGRQTVKLAQLLFFDIFSLVMLNEIILAIASQTASCYLGGDRIP